MEFLGLRGTGGGVAPLPAQIATIKDFPQPATMKKLQGFLGAVNFYRCFIPAAANILLPLTAVLKGSKKGAEILAWSPLMMTAFSNIKAALLRSVCPAFPQDKAELSLATNASATHVGAVLQQRETSTAAWRPLGFFLAKLEQAQLSYSAFDRELYGIFADICHFIHHLEGHRFTIWTDYKPLTFALSRMSDSWTARQQRQLSYVAEFTSKIVHVPGRLNLVADLLSRPQQTATASGPTAGPSPPPVQQTPSLLLFPSSQPTTSRPTVEVISPSSFPTEEALEWAAAAAVTSEDVDLAAMAKDQHSCPATQQLLNSSSLDIIQVPYGQQKLLCDMSSGRQRPLVPATWQRQVFNSLHSLAHTGICVSRRIVSTHFVWKGMAADISQWCRDCLQCQRAKITSNITAPVEPIPMPTQWFSRIQVDLMGPLQASSDGHTHIMTIIDRSTRWVEAVPLSSTTATACADAVVAGWMAVLVCQQSW